MAPRIRHEIEIKLRVNDLAAMRRRLRAAGAQRLHRVHEWNTLFDTPRQSLRKKGHLVRMRLERRLGSRNASPRWLLTYKGPGLGHKSASSAGLLAGAQSGARHHYKVREEVETILLDPVTLTRIFSAMGLTPSFRYEKYRTTYRLPRLQRLLVELDETPIGVFLELEGSPRSIDRASRLLGFTPADYLISSYAALYFDFCRRRGIVPDDMLFQRQK